MAEVEEMEKEKEKAVDLETNLRSKFQVEYDTRLQNEVQKISTRMQEDNKVIVQEAIERIRKEMNPPSEKDVQKLLEQEYVEYTISIPTIKQSDKTKITRSFVIREVPHFVEKKIYFKISSILVPFASEIAALSMNLLEGDAAGKIVKIMNTFQPVLDVMVGVCTIVLNPYGEEEGIDDEWVVKNLSSTRIVKILTAQIECNKMRDFFSLLFQGIKLAK